MGYQSGRIGQHLLRLFTLGGLIAALSVVGCAPKAQVAAPEGAQGLLSRSRDYLAKGFFESVIHQSQRVLEIGENKPPADIALYALGEVYAHHAFSGRDYAVSKQYFDKLISNFPDSPLTWEAKTYVKIFETCGERHTTLDAQPEPSRTTGFTREVRVNQNFAEAVRSNQTLLEQSGRHAPADAALYNLGLIYAHIDNPAKDFHKSRGYFAELSRDFPNSPLAEEARVWVGLFQIIEKMQQIDLDIEQQKKQLKK